MKSKKQSTKCKQLGYELIDDINSISKERKKRRRGRKDKAVWSGVDRVEGGKQAHAKITKKRKKENDDANNGGCAWLLLLAVKNVLGRACFASILSTLKVHSSKISRADAAPEGL